MKTAIIDMSDSVKDKSGKDMEQWFFRILVLVCLGMDHIPV